MAELHVDRDVSGGAAGEERRDARIFQATQNQRVGVAADAHPDDDRVDDQRDEEHDADEQQDERTVGGEDLEAARGDRGVDEAEDAERSQADDPAHDLRHGLRDVLEHGLGRLLGSAQRDAEDDGPRQDADVIGVHERVDRVGEDVLHEGDQNGADALGCGGDLLRRVGKRDVDGEDEARRHGDEGSQERRDDVEDDDGLHGTCGLGVCQGGGYQEEDENRGDRLQGADEQRAEQADEDAEAGVPTEDIGGAAREDAQNGTDDHADDDSPDKADVIPFLQNVHVKLPIIGVERPLEVHERPVHRYGRDNKPQSPENIHRLRRLMV